VNSINSTSLSSSAKPRVCVAGCGHWGKNLARNFSTLGTLGAICESDVARLQSFQQQYPSAHAYAKFEEVLRDPAIDAVVLATPAEHHCRMAIAALRAGKDVFAEKPLALTWREGADMVETARQHGRLLMVGHLLRYHPAILKVQELVAQPAFGRIEYIYSNRLSMGKIRQEENALWSFAPHDISVILALMGRLPLQVCATGGAYLQPNIADVTVSNLLFDHGARSHIFVSWLHPYKEQRLVVIGSNQMAVFEDTRPDNKLILYDKKIEWKDRVIEGAKSQGIPVTFDAEEPLRRECQHFIDCVATRRAPNTPGEEGIEVLKVLQACQRSLEMNGEPVQVDATSLQHTVRL
jgi:UDP-2-acetamido-3-amino-2,3-dideoxy-glucuronate N-acetyltransferase